MNKNKKWHGVDANNEASLFEYGFLMRWSYDETYEVVFKSSWDFDTYHISTFTPSEWIEDLINKHHFERFPNLADIAENECMEEGEFILKAIDDPVFLLDALLSIYTTADILGTPMKEYTEQEIRKRLNKALS